MEFSPLELDLSALLLLLLQVLGSKMAEKASLETGS
jgi:hypothetical protein